jgi:hypothetical protein
MAFLPPPGLPQGVQQPTAPTSGFIPTQPAIFAVDPRAIAGCLCRNTYVWLSNGDQFWFFLVFVGPRTAQILDGMGGSGDILDLI